MLSSTLRARSFASPGVRIWAILVALCVTCAWGAVALAGTKTGLALALIVALGPVAFYAALTAPIIFPFSLFLVMIPFDNLLVIGPFGTLTRVLGLACAAALAVKLLLSRRYVLADKAVLAWIPFLLISIASVTWAMDTDKALTFVGTLLQLFALYALVSFMPIDRKTLGIVITAIIVGGVLAGVYGAYLFHNGQGVSADGRLFINTGTQRIDPNHFAASLLVPFALALTAFLEARGFAFRTFAITALVLIAGGLLVSGSRGGIVSSLVVMAYLFAHSGRRKQLILIGITVAGCAVAVAAFGTIFMRFSQIVATGGAGRLGIWKVSAVAFMHHPLLGAGVGNFSNSYDQAYLTVPAFTMRILEGAYWNIAPHNDIVWVAVELGTLGIITLTYAWWMQYRSVRGITSSSDLYPLRIAVEAAVLAQFVDGLFLGTLTYKYLWLAFMLAMIVRNAELDKGGPQREGVVSPVLQTATRRI